MKLEIEVEEGDVLIINGKRWKVDEDQRGTLGGTLDMTPLVGEMRNFDREKIEEMIEYSGDIRLIRSDYVSVANF
jgi:hypothetical protein